MKQIFTLVFAILAMNVVVGQSNIANGDLENWHTVTLNPTLSYEDLGANPTDNWLATLNSLVAVPPTAGGPGPVTVFKTTDKYSGTYASKAVSANFPLGPVNVFIPGMMGTAAMATTGIKAFLGRPCADCRPLKFKGYYKYEPANGDSCTALILLSKWNDVTKKRDTLGYGKMVQKNAVSTYTPFEIPVNYTAAGKSDSMTLLCISSAAINVVNFMGCAGQAGSTMYVDELMLEYAAGVEQHLMPEVGVKVFPNPASDMINFQLTKNIGQAEVEIFNAEGKVMGTWHLEGQNSSLPVGSFPAGSYHFRLKEGKSILNTGSFVVTR